MLWYPELYYPDKGSPAAGAPLVLHQRQLAEKWYRDGKVPLQLKNIWTVRPSDGPAETIPGAGVVAIYCGLEGAVQSVLSKAQRGDIIMGDEFLGSHSGDNRREL